MASLVDVLSTVSGISKDDTRKIFEEVKANHARLKACAGPHEFIDDPVDGRPQVVWKKKCTRCGGTVDRIHAAWYEDGLRHGRRG